jgi:ribosomal protein L1
MKKLIPFAVAAAFTLGACASDSGAGSSPSMTENDAKTAVMAAEAELKAAKAKGAEWRDTGKLIKQANEAIKAGDFDTATKLANKAKRQSTNALAQAEEQKNAGPHY